MSFVFLTALFLTIWQTVVKRMGGSIAWRSRPIPARAVWLGAGLLPLGFAGELATVFYGSQHDQLRDQAWLATLPLHLAFSGAAPGSAAHRDIVTGVLLSVVTQTIGLFLLSFGRLERLNRLAPYLAGIVMASLAIASPVLTSTDVFFYSYVSTIGRESYSAVAVPSGSPYSFLIAHMPLTGNIYGPLWTAFDVAVGSFGGTLHDKIIAFRLANAILLLCAAFTIRFMGYSRRVQLAFVLNPMLWFYFVTNAHNDIFAITLCFLAVAVVRRHPWLAVALVAGAGAYKISYLLTGSFAFLRLRSRKTSVALTFAAGAIGVVISWLVLGHSYLSQLTSYAHGRHATSDSGVKILIVTLAVIALSVAARAILFRRMQPAGAWVFPFASPAPFPWYLIWGLPYAAVVRRGFGATLLLLPAGAALGEQVFEMNVISSSLCYATLVLILTDLLYRSVRRRQATALTSS